MVSIEFTSTVRRLRRRLQQSFKLFLNKIVSYFVLAVLVCVPSYLKYSKGRSKNPSKANLFLGSFSSRSVLQWKMETSCHWHLHVFDQHFSC